jgi:hypothetical protein
MPALEHLAVLAVERPHALPPAQRGALLDPHLGTSAVRRKAAKTATSREKSIA